MFVSCVHPLRILHKLEVKFSDASNNHEKDFRDGKRVEVPTTEDGKLITYSEIISSNLAFPVNVLPSWDYVKLVTDYSVKSQQEMI